VEKLIHVLHLRFPMLYDVGAKPIGQLRVKVDVSGSVTGRGIHEPALREEFLLCRPLLHRAVSVA